MSDRIIDQMEPGQIWEMRAHDNVTGQPKTMRFTVLEKGLYASPTKPGAFFRGVKIKWENGEVQELPELVFETGTVLVEPKPATSKCIK